MSDTEIDLIPGPWWARLIGATFDFVKSIGVLGFVLIMLTAGACGLGYISARYGVPLLMTMKTFMTTFPKEVQDEINQNRAQWAYLRQLNQAELEDRDSERARARRQEEYAIEFEHQVCVNTSKYGWQVQACDDTEKERQRNKDKEDLEAGLIPGDKSFHLEHATPTP